MPDNVYNGFQSRQFSQPDIPDVLDLDPGTINNPYYQQEYAKRAALKGLQLGNQTAQQKIDLADPDRMRIEHARNLDSEVSLEGHQGGEVDKYKTGLDSLRKFGLVRAEGQATNANVNEAAFSPAAKLTRSQKLEDEGRGHQNKLEEIAAQANAKPLGESGSKALNGYEDMRAVGQRLIDTIDKYDTHAKNFNQEHGILGQLPGVGSALFKNYLYQHGITDPSEDEQWLAGLMQAKGVAAMTGGGRPSVAWINMLGQHLTDPKFAFGANRDRAQQFVNMIPQFEQNVFASRGRTMPANSSAPSTANDPLRLR